MTPAAKPSIESRTDLFIFFTKRTTAAPAAVIIHVNNPLKRACITGPNAAMFSIMLRASLRKNYHHKQKGTALLTIHNPSKEKATREGWLFVLRGRDCRFALTYNAICSEQRSSLQLLQPHSLRRHAACCHAACGSNPSGLSDLSLSTTKPPQGGLVVLRGRDSNPDDRFQRPASYRWMTPEDIEAAFWHTTPPFVNLV